MMKKSARHKIESKGSNQRTFNKRTKHTGKDIKFKDKNKISAYKKPLKKQSLNTEKNKSKREKFIKTRKNKDRAAFKKSKQTHLRKINNNDLIRLNRYIANAGVCSRREADKLIKSGAIMVNGKVVSELGTKVAFSDKIQYGGETLTREKLKYVLLNKPKGFITSMDDPFERKTVMNLVGKACKERIYPVGRLDRNTTGVLLFTNDGKLAKKLTHPKYNVKKIYHIVLDKMLTKNDMKKMVQGIELEDGIVNVDAIAYVGGSYNKRQVGIEIHSGKNRIVRRIFESLGYKIIHLDRAAFAGLTKKGIPRGEWRFLKDKEIYMLKML